MGGGGGWLLPISDRGHHAHCRGPLKSAINQPNSKTGKRTGQTPSRRRHPDAKRCPRCKLGKQKSRAGWGVSVISAIQEEDHEFEDNLCYVEKPERVREREHACAHARDYESMNERLNLYACKNAPHSKYQQEILGTKEGQKLSFTASGNAS